MIEPDDPIRSHVAREGAGELRDRRGFHQRALVFLDEHDHRGTLPAATMRRLRADQRERLRFVERELARRIAIAALATARERARSGDARSIEVPVLTRRENRSTPRADDASEGGPPTAAPGGRRR